MAFYTIFAQYWQPLVGDFGPPTCCSKPKRFNLLEQGKIQNVAEEAVSKHGAFLVDLEIKPNNVIVLYADADEGLNMDQIKMINREVEKALDRDEEDFSLTVSSPDLNRPLKIRRQYQKNIGRALKVKHEDRETKGDLVDVNDEGIILSVKPKKKNEPAQEVAVQWADLTEAKIVVQFK